MVVGLVLVVACKSQAPQSDVGVPSATATTAPPVASAHVDAARLAPPSPAEVAARWNDAHVRHDALALESLYAPRVAFYGQSLTSKECAARKQNAFAKDPSYTQTIKDVVATERDAGASSLVMVHFTKTSTAKGKSTDYPSTLVLDRAGLIESESDDVSEANLATLAAAASTWCTDNVPDVFDAIPNDKIISPYKLSARDVWRRTPDSKIFKDLVAANHGDFLVLDVIQCPTHCDRAAHDCGYTMRVGNHGHVEERFPFMVAWLYVDAVDGTIALDGKSEPLPPP